MKNHWDSVMQSYKRWVAKLATMSTVTISTFSFAQSVVNVCEHALPQNLREEQLPKPMWEDAQPSFVVAIDRMLALVDKGDGTTLHCIVILSCGNGGYSRTKMASLQQRRKTGGDLAIFTVDFSAY